MTVKPGAVGLPETAKRIGYSYDHARWLVSQGTFPIPALPRHGRRKWLFSEYDIERYLSRGATNDARKGAA